MNKANVANYGLLPSSAGAGESMQQQNDDQRSDGAKFSQAFNYPQRNNSGYCSRRSA